MAIDPNDLLIFKKKQTVGQSKPQPIKAAQQQATVQAEQKAPAPTAPPKPAAAPAIQKAVQEIAPPSQQAISAPISAPISTSAYGPAPAASPAPQPKNVFTNYYDEKREESARLEQEAAETTPDAVSDEDGHLIAKQQRKLTKTEKKNIESGKGQSCVLHPWRGAYATCEYCKRPFCYADLIDYKGAPCCIEDINEVSREHGGEINYWNSFTYISAAVMLANSSLLLYYIYPQTNFLVAYLTSAGVLTFIMNTNFSYAMASINIMLSALGFISGLALILKVKHSFAFGGIVSGAMLLILSYGYINTNTQYLLISSALSAISITMIAMGRMAATGAEYLEINKSPSELDWPRLETF